MNVLDCETYLNKNIVTPYCVCFIIKNKTISYYGENCIIEALEYIFEKTEKITVIYIHNINFDGFLIIEALSLINKKFSVFADNLNIYNIIIENDNKQIIFRCSYKLLPMSLKKIGMILGEEKIIYPYKFINKSNLFYKGAIPDSCFFNNIQEYNEFKSKNIYFDVEKYTIKYCIKDLIITKKFIENLKEIILEFGIKIESINSAPSLALKIFEKKFNKNRIKLSYQQSLDKIARASYYGGKCEVYGNPKKNEKIYHFDFTGMYAQCMMEKYPFGECTFNTNSKDFIKPGIYWIEFESIDMYLPILPHHRIKDGKLMFTNGKLTGAFWFEEIILFIKNGGKIIKILYSITFEKYDYIFNEYTDFFLKLRKKSEICNIFGKLMINSIYGRLGMRDIENYSFIDKKENINEIAKKIDIVSFHEMNNIVMINCINNNKLENFLGAKKKKIKNNIVIASAITSKARIKLYKAQNEVIINKGRLLYSDTDSIFAAFNYDVLGKKFGEIYWDPNKKDTLIKEAVFFSAKSYALKTYDNESIIKIKGYNQKNLNYDDVLKLSENNKNLKLNKYLFLSKKNMNLTFNETIKIFDLNAYDKRIFKKSKTETIAYTYDKYLYK